MHREEKGIVTTFELLMAVQLAACHADVRFNAKREAALTLGLLGFQAANKVATTSREGPQLFARASSSFARLSSRFNALQHALAPPNELSVRAKCLSVREICAIVSPIKVGPGIHLHDEWGLLH